MTRKMVARLMGPALFLSALILMAPFGTAQAARSRPVVAQERVPNQTPTTPEPAAAIVFGIGVALVAWRSRRSRSSK
jgi:hypothetical protein